MSVAGRTYDKDWKKITEKDLCAGRDIDPISYAPCNGDGKFFDVKISDKELKEFIDKNGNLRYHCVYKWALPKLGEERYCEWIAARMRNYILHIVLPDGYNPRFYKLKENYVILADHVARFFDASTLV